jgi:diphthine-ammonia ligase
MDARLVKTCSLGLKACHLGKPVSMLKDMFDRLEMQFDFNVCGEGGEYESAVFDCPLFKTKRIVVEDSKVVVHGNEDDFSAPCSLLLTKLGLEDKSEDVIAEQAIIMEERKV